MYNRTFFAVLGLLVCTVFVAKAQYLTKNNEIAIGKQLNLYSQILKENRVVNIYLPSSYQEKDSLRFPVLYLLDGGIDEDFASITGLSYHNSLSWVNRWPECIVVGIANVDRKRDFTYPSKQESDLTRFPTSGKSENFALFLEKELIPFVEKNYRTSPRRCLQGQSLAGLFATEVLLKKPHLFSEYIIISPSLWWDNGSLLKVESPLFQKQSKPMVSVYIGVGKEGLAPSAVPHVMEVDANLLAEQLKKSSFVQAYFDYLPQENHGTITLQAANNGMIWLGSLLKKP